MQGFGDRVREARVAKGWPQRELALEVTKRGFKIRQSAIGNMEKKARTEPRCLPELAAALDRTVNFLRTGRGPKSVDLLPQNVHTFAIDGIERPQPSGGINPSLLLWRTSLGVGTEPGVFMLNAGKGKPIERPSYLLNEDKAFSFRVVGNENDPVYRLRDYLWVNPDEPLEAGEDCLFLHSPNDIEGSQALVARLVRFTEGSWFVMQHATKEERTLSRKLWRVAWVIVGRERRR